MRNKDENEPGCLFLIIMYSIIAIVSWFTFDWLFNTSWLK